MCAFSLRKVNGTRLAVIKARPEKNTLEKTDSNISLSRNHDRSTEDNTETVL